MVNSIRAEISQGFTSQKKMSTELSLDSQYACLLTQLLQGQAEIRQDMQKVNEVLCVCTFPMCLTSALLAPRTPVITGVHT